MTATFDARIDGDDLDDHYWSTPIHDQLDRDLRATWLQQPGLPVSDAEFIQAAAEATGLTMPYPATPDLFDGLATAIDDAPEPTVWDKLEDWLTFEWRSWMGWALCLILGGVFGFIVWAWAVTA
ncbi:hypothetical protein L1080_003155 [Rhodococcus sp. MSC1_016]|jgi:hypothetical protein|uniref:hypothetical protein n=1 Tax=Rhodococcus sp. MSC1_016 TaxID=2909266 RepID=UPI00202E6624|nr:hypothetical protein [Rhodococcus sp. MSC1_016]